MTALVLSLLLAADSGGPAPVADVGLPCQRAAIVEFFKLVSSGTATIADVRRLSEFDHDHEVESQLQRCLLFPKEMEALLCTAGDAAKCTFYVHYSPEQEAARPDDNVLPAAQDSVVFERSERRAKGTRSELAAYLLFRWPKVFRSRVSANDISGPWKDAKDEVSIYYRVKTPAGDVVVGFVRDLCTIWDIALPGGQSVLDDPMDCFWRQKAGKKPATSSPPAPAAKDTAILAAATAPGNAVSPSRIELVRVVTESKVPHTFSIERPVGTESTIEVATEFDSDRFGLVVVMADRATKVKVEQRYETSLTVQNEGPHLDLVDWKHYVSDWTELPGDVGGAVRSLPISAEDSSRFPRIEMSSVLAEIGRRDPKWLDVVKNAKSIREYPFSVVVSEITFRVLARVGGEWVPVYVVRLRRPMGC